jgi:general L-amino acid transport system permease protein
MVHQLVNSSERLWLRPGVRAVVWQALAALAICVAVWWIAGNVAANLPRLKMQLIFSFLREPASFQLGDNLLGYRAGDSFGYAFAAGLANTLQVSITGIVLTAIVGVIAALMRLMKNLLIARLAWFYIEVARNLPLLLQLMFWQTLCIKTMPPPRAAWIPVSGVIVSNRGATFATMHWQDAFNWALLALGIGLALAYLFRGRSRARAQAGGAPTLILLSLLPPFLTLWLLAEPPAIEWPALRGLNVAGGVTLVPEFFTLLLGLVFCHAGFAAESIRAGIMSVSEGQWSAARSLGLRWWPTMRLIVLPQALRTMIPPLASNFLSLTKSSSLAVAIGYPDLLRVSTVTISETGRAVECITIILLVYLTLSLVTSSVMNWYNHRIALRGGPS